MGDEVLSSRAYKFMKSPYRMNAMDDASCVGLGGSQCGGPFLRVFLRLNGEQILEASFQTFMCPWAIATGSVLCLTVEGRSCSEVLTLTEGMLELEVGGVPRNRREVIGLAIAAVRNAIGARINNSH